MRPMLQLRWSTAGLLRAVLRVSGLVILAAAIRLTLYKSNMPTVFGRYSLHFFVVLLLFWIAALALGLMSVLASNQAVRKFILVGASIVGSVVLLDISALILAPVLPLDIWLMLPYRVKQSTVNSRPETKRLQDVTQIEDAFYTYEPYFCKDWPILSGPDPVEEDALSKFEVCHDEIGFRNPVGTYADNPTADIVTLGDSFTYGTGAPLSWPDLLRMNTGLKVLNLGLPGGTVPDWIGAYKRYGAEKTPRIVIAATWENDYIGLEKLDLVGNSADRQRQVEYMMGVVPDWESTNPLYAIADYSFTMKLLANLVRSGIFPETHRMRLSLDGGTTQIDLYTDRRPDFPENERLWLLYEKGLSELKRLTDESGAQLVLVYFTTASVIYAPYDVNPSDAVLADVANNRRIAARLADLAAAHGVLFFDPTSLLREGAAKSPLLYSWDGHFSQEGYVAAADMIQTFLNKQGLLAAGN